MIRKFLESLLLKKNNLRKNHGYVMILVAVSIPIFLFAIDYSIKKNKQSHTHVTQKIAAYAVGEAVIKKYQPGKKWSDQIKLVYSFATQALNDKGFVLVKNMIIPTLSISVKSYDINMYPLKQSEVYFYASSYGLLNGYPLSSHALSHEDTLFCDKPPFRQNVSGNDIILTAYTTQQRSDAYNVVFSDPNDEINKQKMELSLDRSNCRIKCDCKCLQKKVYAYPPKCNVDIVMTLPTNDDINQSIPEISAAYQNFLEEDFLHANGVAVGLVPYSGKISISKQQSDWITEPAMEDTPTISNKLYIKQAALYGSEGKCGSPLSFGYYSKNALPLLHIPIMARYGSREDYNGVPIYTGYDMLLSTDNPLISPFHGFRRANLNPCYLGYCNFLSGKCEKECTTFLPNPFFITELTDDLQGVINDLNIIGPVIDDLYNRSNFVFLAVLFSHILLKDWTAYPSTNIKELGKFVHPPRTEKKKAVILLVNEPDRFEPNELTYLGFDNDFSEIPMIESDCIRFDIDYSDTSRKFANGSSYDGIIMGAKKILKFQVNSGNFGRNTDIGFYETLNSDQNVTATLSFPNKYLVKIVVEPKMVLTDTVDLSSHCSTVNGDEIWGVAVSPEQCMVVTGYNGSRTGTAGIFSPNGIDNWTVSTYTISEPRTRGAAYGNGKFLAIGYSSIAQTYDVATSTWIGEAMLRSGGNGTENGYFDKTNNQFIVVSTNNKRIYKSPDGKNWITYSVPSSITPYAPNDIIEHNGKYAITTHQGAFFTGFDFSTLTRVDDGSLQNLGASNIRSIEYHNGSYYALCSNRHSIAKSEDGGVHWREVFYPGSEINNSRCLRWWDKKNRFLLTNPRKKVYHISEEGTITFTNITGGDAKSTQNNTTYTINKKTEFYIEASQINADNTVSFNMNNIRLISAEITNRPYKAVTPTCSLSGTINATNTTGTAYITTNVKAPLKLNADGGGGSVTFSGVNGSSLSVSGAQNLNGIETFHFPAADFRANHTTQKVSFSLKNAEIIDATLIDQTLRCNYQWRDTSGDDSIRKTPKGFDEIVIHPDDHCLTDSSSEQIVFPSISGKAEIQIAKWLCCGGSRCSNPLDIYLDENILVHFDKSGHNTQTYTTYQNVQFRETSLDLCEWCSRHYLTTLQVDKKEHTFDFRNGSGCWITGVIITNNEVLKLEASQSGNNMWIENNCICFHGTGELHVTVKPSAPSIQYSTPTGEHITKSVSSGETITIDPDTYKYERNIDASGNATYTIKLQLDNVQISDPQMVDTMNIYEYIKLRLPEMSRSVDSSRNSNNNFVYNILGAETTGINDYINYNHNSSFAWNAATECWEYSNTSGSNYLECGQYPGDMYWTINVENTQATQSYLCFCTNPNKYEYFDAGLFRLFNPFGGTAWRDNRGNCYPFEVHNCGAGGISFAIGGLTMPINTILYYALAKNIDTYRNINAAGGILYDNDMICQVVTTQACDNLKTEFGDNLRIYVIKYKKLKEKPHKVNTNLRITCDYTYIDACASSPTCIYEATNPLELNTALKAIAKDIKLWTGYHDGYVEECHD